MESIDYLRVKELVRSYLNVARYRSKRVSLGRLKRSSIFIEFVYLQFNLTHKLKQYHVFFLSLSSCVYQMMPGNLSNDDSDPEDDAKSIYIYQRNSQLSRSVRLKRQCVRDSV